MLCSRLHRRLMAKRISDCSTEATSHMTTSTDWSRPPVIEVVLGFQFTPVQGLTNGHLGLFWHSIKDQYPHSHDAPPVPFATDSSWGMEPDFLFATFGVQLEKGDSRLRLTSADGSRMIQVQNGWILANWVKSESSNQTYPGYLAVRQQLEDAILAFNRFLSENKLPEMNPEIWEVTYIDHIEKGTVWNNWTELPAVLPGLLGSKCPESVRLRAIQGTWSYGLGTLPGRLALSVQTARRIADPKVDLIVVRTTARGPIGASPLIECLNKGQAIVVETFMSVASDSAKAFWERR